MTPEEAAAAYRSGKATSYLGALVGKAVDAKQRETALTSEIPGFDTASILRAAQLAATRVRPTHKQATTRRRSMWDRRSMLGSAQQSYVSNRTARASLLGVSAPTAATMVRGG
jgi:hypothetical protein